MVINVMKNNLAECGEHIMIVERTILHLLVIKGLTEKVIPQERPEGGKGESRSDNCEKSSPGTGKSKCEGPEVRRVVTGSPWLLDGAKDFKGEERQWSSGQDSALPRTHRPVLPSKSGGESSH